MLGSQTVFLVKAKFSWPRSLSSALHEDTSHPLSYMKSQGLAKLDKQLPRAASCLVIVYYGSD